MSNGWLPANPGLLDYAELPFKALNAPWGALQTGVATGTPDNFLHFGWGQAGDALTHPDHAIRGRQLLEKLGIADPNSGMAADVGGMALDMADPFSIFALGGLGKAWGALRGAKAASTAMEAAAPINKGIAGWLPSEAAPHPGYLPSLATTLGIGAPLGGAALGGWNERQEHPSDALRTVAQGAMLSPLLLGAAHFAGGHSMTNPAPTFYSKLGETIPGLPENIAGLPEVAGSRRVTPAKETRVPAAKVSNPEAMIQKGFVMDPATGDYVKSTPEQVQEFAGQPAKTAYEQLYAMLRNKGVNPEEIEWTLKGLENESNISRQQLSDQFEHNGIRLEKKVLREKGSKSGEMARAAEQRYLALEQQWQEENSRQHSPMEQVPYPQELNDAKEAAYDEMNALKGSGDEYAKQWYAHRDLEQKHAAAQAEYEQQFARSQALHNAARAAFPEDAMTAPTNQHWQDAYSATLGESEKTSALLEKLKQARAAKESSSTELNKLAGHSDEWVRAHRDLDAARKAFADAELEYDAGPKDIDAKHKFMLAKNEVERTQLARDKVHDAEKQNTARYSGDDWVPPGGLPGTYEEHLVKLAEHPEVTNARNDVAAAEARVERAKNALPDMRITYDDQGRQVDAAKDSPERVEWRAANDELDRARKAAEDAIKKYHTPAHDYEDSHYPGEKGLVGWHNGDMRIGPNGEKVWFVNEVQSPLHQKGREQGYQPANADAHTLSEAEKDARVELFRHAAQEDNLGFDERGQMLDAIARHNDFATRWDMSPEMRAAAEKWKAAWKNREDARNGMPNMPFKDNEWANMLLKDIIRTATEKGADRIAFSNGQLTRGYAGGQGDAGIRSEAKGQAKAAKAKQDLEAMKKMRPSEGGIPQHEADMEAMAKKARSPAMTYWTEQFLPSKLKELGAQGFEHEPLRVFDPTGGDSRQPIRDDGAGGIIKNGTEHLLPTFKIPQELKQRVMERGQRMLNRMPQRETGDVTSVGKLFKMLGGHDWQSGTLNDVPNQRVRENIEQSLPQGLERLIGMSLKNGGLPSNAMDTPVMHGMFSPYDILGYHYQGAPGGAAEAERLAAEYRAGKPDYDALGAGVDPKAVHEKIPVVQAPFSQLSNEAGYYSAQPGGQHVGINTNYGEPQAFTSLEHEFGHASQKPDNFRTVVADPHDRQFIEAIMQTYPAMFGGDATKAMRYAEYILSPHEVGANVIGPAKRLHVAQTGEHVRTPADAKQALMSLLDRPADSHLVANAQEKLNLLSKHGDFNNIVMHMISQMPGVPLSVLAALGLGGAAASQDQS